MEIQFYIACTSYECKSLSCFSTGKLVNVLYLVHTFFVSKVDLCFIPCRWCVGATHRDFIYRHMSVIYEYKMKTGFPDIILMSLYGETFTYVAR